MTMSRMCTRARRALDRGTRNTHHARARTHARTPMKQLQEPDRAGECRNTGDEEDADAAGATPNAPFPFVYGLGCAVGIGATNCFNHLFGGRYVQEGERELLSALPPPTPRWCRAAWARRARTRPPRARRRGTFSIKIFISHFTRAVLNFGAPPRRRRLRDMGQGFRFKFRFEKPPNRAIREKPPFRHT